jgi:hypothetical protein
MDGGTGKGGCVNLECAVPSCPTGGKTTLSGRVFAPEGTIPLYNAIVYIPNSKPDPFNDGATCDQCGKVTGHPITTTLTNEKGEFHLDGVPVGQDIPIVFQIGKWRRQVTAPILSACSDNHIDPALTRMPRSRDEGDIPKIAITSGSADSLECFLRKVGIADSEFGSPGGPGRVDYFTGNGASMSGGSPAAATLWNSTSTLMKYDIAILSCEGGERTGDKAQYYQQMLDYVNAGGRVFASHYHYVWWRYGPAPLPTTADWQNAPGTHSPYAVDVDFPKGQAFAEWLVTPAVGASTTKGQIDLLAVRDSVGDSNPSVSRRWIHSDDPKAGKYFSFNTPIGVSPDKQCGRAVFTDVHVSVSPALGTFPDFCSNPIFGGGKALNPNEKALIFLFFDLASCVQDESKPPEPPPAR